MLCCAAAQSIPDHPSAGGIYAASEDPPPFSSFDRRRCSSCNPARVRDLLLHSPSFQYLASTSMPVEMPYAPQPPPAPMNVARLLNGNWMATYLCVANS